MWKVLGKEAMYIDIGPVWAERIVELSGEYEGDDRFKELMSKPLNGMHGFAPEDKDSQAVIRNDEHHLHATDGRNT